MAREFGPYRFWGNIDPSGREKPPILVPARAELDDPAVDGTTATLRLYDVIDSYGGFWGVSAKEFNAALDQVPSSVTDLQLHINSPGGEVYEGIAILNALRRHPATVTAVVDGLAASAASFIATGANRTVMAPNTEMMIHDAWGIVIGPAEDMRFMAGRLDASSDNIAGVYAEKAGGDVATWRAAMLAETWYSAQEAVDAGLADEIEGAAAPDDSEIIANRFARSAFKHASRAEAGPPVVPDADAAAGVAAALRRSKMAARRAERHGRRASLSAAG